MGVFKQFATNRNLEKNGVPLKFAPNPDGTIPTILVKRAYRESPAYQAAFTRITKPYKDAIASGALDPDTDQQLMMQVAAETSVAGWENWRLPVGAAGIGKGENTSVCDIPFSAENVFKTFQLLPDLWRLVANTASDPDAYKDGDLEEMAKNL